MGEQLDYTTLTWVKDEIQESLNQTQQALEFFVEDPSDTTQIRFCATYLHQVYGTLQMVEIYGAALLAEEMEQVANALLNDQIGQKEDAYEVLMRAIIQLPSYLESLERGQMDMPVILTPLLNDLRAARGEPLLSENTFFKPDLNVAPPEKRLTPGKSYPDIQIYARKLRPIYQISLLGVLRNNNATGSLKKIAAVLRELQNASAMDALQRLWWIGGGIIEALIDEGQETSTAIKMLMGQIDREIKRVIDQGEDAIATAPPEELMKNCLYYAGTSTSNGPRVSSLQQAFKLDEILPYGGALEKAQDDLKGSTADIMENVSSMIKEDLLHVKDQLDIFVRNNQREVTELTPLSENLGRIADTLAMLGLGDLRRVIQDQVSNINTLVAAAANPGDDALMEIASALLYVEASLDNIKTSRREHSEENAPDLAMHDEEDAEVLLPASEQIQITHLVIKEAKQVLADVKDGFNTFAVDPDQFDIIRETPQKLAQIQGALAIMNLDHASRLLGAANAFIRDDVIAAQAIPNAAKLDTLADAITSIEYYLEAIEEGRRHPEGVLAIAEISVEQLGHPVDSVSPVIHAKTDDGLEIHDEQNADDQPAPEAEPQEILDSPTETLTAPEPDTSTQAEETFVAEDSADESIAEPVPEPISEQEAEPAAVSTDSTEPEEYPEEDIDEEILEIFIEEADEVLGIMTDCLHAWRANPEDEKPLETLRRSYHTIKGSGRLAGAVVMGDLAWAFENLLNRVLDNKITPQPAMFKLLEQAEITVQALLRHLKKETDIRPPVKHLSEQATAMADGQEFNISEVVDQVIPSPETSPKTTTAEPVETTDATEAFLTDQDTPDIEAEPTQEITLEPEVDTPEVDTSLETQPETRPEDKPVFDQALVDVFRKETAIHIATIRDFLGAADGHEKVVDDNLHRALHTLLGSSRMANIAPITELSETMDRVTRAMHTRALKLDNAGQQLLREIADAVELIATGFDQDNFVNPDNSALQTRIAMLYEHIQSIPAEEAGAEIIGFESAPEPAIEAATEDKADELVEPEPSTEPEVTAEEFEEFEDVISFETASTEPAAVSAAVDVDYDPDLLEVFLEEAEEIQENTERELHQWASQHDNISHVAELQRLLHTLKGGARMANVAAVGDLAHAMESLLERITDGRTQPEPEHTHLLQACHDWLVHGLGEARKLKPVAQPEELLAQLEAAIHGEKIGPAATPEPEPADSDVDTPVVEAAIEEAPSVEPLREEETEEIAGDISLELPKASIIEQKAAPGSEEQVRVSAGLLNNLVNFSGEINIYNSRIAQQLGTSRFNLAELDQTVFRLREQLRKFEIETETQIIYRHETTTGDNEDFDPLELDRFSNMQQLSRGMVESLGDLTSIQNILESLSSESDILLLQQQRVTGELQDGLMRTRMVSFSSILPRLRRILRQTCKETGKQAELRVTGAEGELDRTQLNRIIPALEHILRNAVGHGLETPEQRTKLGKDAKGAIHIDFSHQGSEVVLSISDDGAGINIDNLRNKAIEKGRMVEGADLSDAEIIEFILESGFSTAEEVTQVSGRGVGMDVVNNEIKQLGGTLHIATEADKGSTFTMRLPLTVLVNQALLVQVGEATYAIQLPNIEHVVRVAGDELARLISGEQALLEYADNQYQYLNLGAILQGTPAQAPPDQGRVPLMLIRSAGHRIALQVDNLLGRRDIVIKSVGPQLSAVGVLSGATILPDGEIALILDVGNLIRSALAQKQDKAKPLLPTVEEITAKDQAPTVMIVDDSITVRKVTERILKRHNYNIITAKDGVDALTMMIDQIPDIMLLDVEMPRMDGYELATTMRNDPRLNNVPIIMITSRTGDKHRQRALDIGVNMYMGKPYQEHELIDNIRSLTGVTQG
jgi:chemosensory pili system protein ChpA (sensor histidine kinase/response regulator)